MIEVVWGVGRADVGGETAVSLLAGIVRVGSGGGVKTAVCYNGLKTTQSTPEW